MQIKDLADKSGVSVRTIRYYTQIGLLPEVEKNGQYKDYPEEMIDRLKKIKELQTKYIPLEKIKDILNNNSEAAEGNIELSEASEATKIYPAMIYKVSNDITIIVENGKRLSQEKLNKIKEIL